MTGKEKEKQDGDPKVKNIGFVNHKWTEILVEIMRLNRPGRRKESHHTNDEEGGKEPPRQLDRQIHSVG